ncbi:MAG: LysM peptidoglycan-binding domain-containing M23 family metallopeptidase [Pseudomonadota bacterium]
MLGACQSSRPAPLSERSPVDDALASSYRVAPGDSLYAIAWRYRLDVDRLAAWNGKRAPFRLLPGETLRLRPPAAARSRAATPALPPRSLAEPTDAAIVWHWPVSGTLGARLARSFAASGAGVDFRLPPGTPIRVAAAGTVVYAGTGLGRFEQLVILRHGPRYLSAYGFNGRRRLEEGERAQVGALVADIEAIGSGDALLHFEIRDRGTSVDPQSIIH